MYEALFSLFQMFTLPGSEQNAQMTWAKVERVEGTWNCLENWLQCSEQAEGNEFRRNKRKVWEGNKEEKAEKEV